MAPLTKKHCSDLNGKHILHTLTFFHFAISSSADQCDLKERGRATLRSTLAKRPRSRWKILFLLNLYQIIYVLLENIQIGYSRLLKYFPIFPPRSLKSIKTRRAPNPKLFAQPTQTPPSVSWFKQKRKEKLNKSFKKSNSSPLNKEFAHRDFI